MMITVPILNSASTQDPRPLEVLDPVVHGLLIQEAQRQQTHIELIASENFTLPAIREAVGSVLTNKYAEGYPGRRYYGGCVHVDAVESVAISRACSLFGAEHANVQPHSGSQANQAVYQAVLSPGDNILTMSLVHGGHLTHGHPKNFSGILYSVDHYGVDPETGLIDYTQLEHLAQKLRPKLITVGASAYPRVIDFERMGAIAQQAGALLLADIAHIAGLVVAGLHPSPFPYADFVTTTTHKTLRGPRGGLILCKKAYAQAVDSAVFPGVQGGPLMHVIAGKAVCFHQAAQPNFQAYQAQVRHNAQALAEGMRKRGYTLVSGGTDNHLLLVDLRPRYPNLTGRQAQDWLDSAHITCNRNTIPGETRNPFQASGLRLGSPAVTTRGMGVEEMDLICGWIDQVLGATDAQRPSVIKRVAQDVIACCERFPLV